MSVDVIKFQPITSQELPPIPAVRMDNGLFCVHRHTDFYYALRETRALQKNTIRTVEEINRGYPAAGYFTVSLCDGPFAGRAVVLRVKCYGDAVGLARQLPCVHDWTQVISKEEEEEVVRRIEDLLDDLDADARLGDFWSDHGTR